MKKVNAKSNVNQEIWKQVYDPVAGKKVMCNIYPLLQGRSLKGRDRDIAESMTVVFIFCVCDYLGLYKPNVEFYSTGFPSKDTEALYSDNDRTFRINRNYDGTLAEKLYGIAYKLRLMQMNGTDPSWLSGCKQVDEIGLEEYLLQKPIADAIAFATFIIDLCFEFEIVVPYPDSVRDAVSKREELFWQEAYRK